MKTNALFPALALLACSPQGQPTDELQSSSAPVTTAPTTTTTEPPPAPVDPPPVDPPPPPPPAQTGFPCEVRAALQAACATCHAGAVYIPGFQSRDDFLVDMGSGQTFGQRMVTRLWDPQRPMPPPGVQRPLSAEERSTLSTWVSQGMPAGACGDLE